MSGGTIFLAPLFIFVFRMGIAGAATATLLSQVCGFCILFAMTNSRRNIRIRPRNFSFSRQLVKEIIAGGTPSLSRQGLGSLATIIVSNMLLQTIRKPIRANILAAARSGLFFIPLVVVLPRLFGIVGLEVSQALADVCAFAITVPIAWSAFRDMRGT